MTACPHCRRPRQECAAPDACAVCGCASCAQHRGRIRIAYADPPYLGLCRLYDHSHGGDGKCWDDPETHRALVGRLMSYDRWAMSLTSGSLHTILPMCPPDTRVMAWVKPFASFKKGVRVAYAWEPLLVYGAPNSGSNGTNTVRDWCSVPITLRRGFKGAKPEAVMHWLFEVLGANSSCLFDDLFHGSGAVKKAWQSWLQLEAAWTAR